MSFQKKKKKSFRNLISDHHRSNPRSFHIQLFRQRLSHKSVKAYATMLIGVMGKKSLALILIEIQGVYQQEKRRHK